MALPEQAGLGKLVCEHVKIINPPVTRSGPTRLARSLDRGGPGRGLDRYSRMTRLLGGVYAPSTFRFYPAT